MDRLISADFPGENVFSIKTNPKKVTPGQALRHLPKTVRDEAWGRVSEWLSTKRAIWTESRADFFPNRAGEMRLRSREAQAWKNLRSLIFRLQGTIRG